jgi:PRC-barrel domain
MRNDYRAAAASTALAALFTPVLYSMADDSLTPRRQEGPPTNSATKLPGASEPSVTILDNQEAQGILGKEVRGAADENMGRIVDVIADRNGQVKAAIIDFGGFLGVGSRKIAVAWSALHFLPNAKKGERISLELTRDQVRSAPEYKEDKPILVLGASGNLESLPESANP